MILVGVGLERSTKSVIILINYSEIMKKIFIFIALFILLAIGVTQVKALNASSLDNLFSYSICDEPIKYRIDTVDPKFNLSKEQFSLDVNQAAQIWNNEADKNLFIYDPAGDLSINLIYDERQSLNNQIQQLEDTVKSDKQSLNPKVNEYEKLASEFKQKVIELNKKIEEWNNKGGAPPDEYKKIIEEQQSLQSETDRLNSMAKSLNISTQEYNSQVNNLNQTIKTFNNAITERPEEGIFKGPENRIEIYFNISKTELVHTIAHELGHALGLDHLQNPKAIMYSKTNQSIVLSDDDEKALEELCRRHSIFEVIQVYLSRLFSTLHIQT